MKTLLLILALSAPCVVFAQALNEYQAPNGKIYRKGDSLSVGLGSMPDGTFKYIQINSLIPAPPDPRRANSMNARKDITGGKYYIKKIVSAA
jgi:hypothetical protein